MEDLMQEERQRILDMYKGLRVTDVNDAMDVVGRMNLGMMDHDIRPLHRDVENLTHCFVGFAHTVRFLPTNRPITAHTPQEMKDFIRHWYRTWAGGPKQPIEAGDVIVIDGSDTEVGFIGSNNGFKWITDGAVGIVTNGAARDTDELIRQKCAVYSKRIVPTIRPARLEFDAEQVPINCGGVMVRPGDLVVADGDGVVVVPIEIVEEVAMYAREIANGDRATRRTLYEKSGMAFDETVEELGEPVSAKSNGKG
jgi:4-hydroxy-4-methyl-2-oxoglutarate aldolase